MSTDTELYILITQFCTLSGFILYVINDFVLTSLFYNTALQMRIPNRGS